MDHINTELANKLVTIAVKQVEVAAQFKKSRMDDIEKSVEFYNGKKRKTLKGRFAVPMPFLQGFVDTLMSKIDDAPSIKYTYTDLADFKRAMKISAAAQRESEPMRGNWPSKDRQAKKLAIFSGRAIFKYYAESDPKYKSNLEVIDYYNFLCEPKGGIDLENHLFLGQQNIFRTENQLQNGSQYEPTQVLKLLASFSAKEEKKNERLYKDMISRSKSLGLDMENNSYVGVPMANLIEWYMVYEGKRYYLLFDYGTEIWVRAHLLTDVFEDNIWPYFSWATHEDAFNFWSKSPCDDIRPLADAVDVLVNQALDNRQKINCGQRAFDANIFTDPSQLEWKQDGLVLARVPANKSIRDGVYKFETQEISGTIDLAAFLDSFAGRKTGITPEAEGVAEKNQKVGVYFGNIQQVADRLGLYNKAYKEAYQQLGLRYWHGLKAHLREKMAIKILGSKGVEWDKLITDDLETSSDFDIEITGGDSEVKANEVKKQRRTEAIGLILKSQDLSAGVNIQWLIQQILETGDFDEANIKIAMNKDNLATVELLSEAEQAIQEIIGGKEPKRNRGANTAYIQYIIDFAIDTDLEPEIFDKLMEYAKVHLTIAAENMARRAMAERPQMEAQGQPQLKVAEEVSVNEPVPGSPSGTLPGTLSQSQRISGAIRGK